MAKVDIDITKKLTDEQIKMLREAASKEVEFDSDCWEFTDAELMQFKKISDKHQNERKKQTVSLRLSPQALAKAKSLGKGYTSVLSRILENALNDNEVIKRNL